MNGAGSWQNETRKAFVKGRSALMPAARSAFARNRAAGRGDLATTKKDGAPRRIRTADPLLTKQLLYQLSYWGNARLLPSRSDLFKTPSRDV